MTVQNLWATKFTCDWCGHTVTQNWETEPDGFDEATMPEWRFPYLPSDRLIFRGSVRGAFDSKSCAVEYYRKHAEDLFA